MKLASLLATAVAATMAAGCAGNVDKSGGRTEVTTLVLAGFEGERTLDDPAVAHFAERVDELSGGGLKVDAPSKWFDSDEQGVLEDVIAGGATLGWTGTRALDLIDVDAFQPLHAPFLINSYEAEKGVVADGVTQDMLDSLEDAGLTGLALLADELRLPVASEAPLLGPEDYENLTFGLFASEMQTQAVSALGARAAEIRGGHGDEAQAMEASWPPYLRNHRESSVPFVTVNAALWPRTTVLVANPAKLAELSSEDREVIEQAAAEAAAWSVEHADDRVLSEMAMACARGVRMARASAHQLRALREAVEPVYEALRAEPEQAAILARVEQLVQEAGTPEPVVIPDGCAYQPGDQGPEVRVLPEPLDGPGRSGELPSGTYRYVLTEDEINAAIEDADYDVAGANAGVWTWTLGNGRWANQVQLTAQELPEGFDDGLCEGYYDVLGDQVDFTTVTEGVHGECAPATWKAIWRETQDGLSIHVITDDDYDFFFGAKTWEPIG